MSEMSSATVDRAEIKDTATAEKFLAKGLESETQHDRIAAIEAYEAAYAADPDNIEVCFRLAYCLDLVGEVDEALHLYEECAHSDKPSLNVLMNLAVMYEDRGKYSQAERCLRQVLATEPNHDRARLYIKDVLASKGMIIDDEQEKRDEKHMALLDTPVTDFELSVRTRNALRKMSIRTLGDLLNVSEAELRSFKNFGDASLDEIKAMLAQKGLRLGQTKDANQQAAKQKVYDELREQTGDSEVLARSVNELNLSVRARKALALLGIATLGDLAMKTEAELMGVKNFGMTSLVEIREKLQDFGLGLRQIEAS